MHTNCRSLHQKELPFRAIFKTIGGTTTSCTTFTCPLGNLCGSNYHHLPKVKFEHISGLLDNFYPTSEAMNDLSDDKQLLIESEP